MSRLLCVCLLLAGCSSWQTTDGGFYRYGKRDALGAIAGKTLANAGVAAAWAVAGATVVGLIVGYAWLGSQSQPRPNPCP